MVPTLQELQKEFEIRYDCIFRDHHINGRICVKKTNMDVTLENGIYLWCQFIIDESNKYIDKFASVEYPSNTQYPTITTWDYMYGQFYDQYIKSMPERNEEIQKVAKREEMIKSQKDQVITREMKLQKEKEEAKLWAANRLPGEKHIHEIHILDEYRWHIQKTEKISKIMKLDPSFLYEEIESVLHYLDSLKPSRPTTKKYTKNTLLAMKALNRYARENEIDVNSAIIVWNEYLT